MLKIGNISLESPVILGPMAGITSLAYRDFMKPFGVGLSYSEMISDCGICYGNSKTMEYIKTSSLDRPVGLQLFGSSIETTTKAIEIIENSGYDYDILDINLGCPVPKVTNAGSGSSWLKRPNELYEYMREVVKKSSKPVTAKIRLGWDDKTINFKEIVALLEKAGVVAITIHARTAKQGYAGTANYEVLKDLGESMKVPLIISGDIYSVDDVIKATETTKCSGIMVARGGVGNPSLIKQINAYYKGEEIPKKASLNENISYLKKYAELLIKEKGEKSGIMILRGIAPKFLLNYPNTKQARIKLAQNMTTFDDLLSILSQLK